MRFKVPQNIDMADRIVGPLTLVQFLYLLIGGVLIYFLFTTVALVNMGLFLLTAVPVAFFTFAMTFLKIQDQPFPKFVRAFAIYLSRPKMRIWHKDGPDAGLVITPEKAVKTADLPHKAIKKAQLDKLTQVLDTGGNVPRENMHSPGAETLRQAQPTRTKRPSLDTVRKQHG